MTDDPVLVHEWHPVGKAEELADGGVKAVRLLGRDLVLWRAGDQFMAWQDLCVHRGAKFSLGKVTADGCLRCPYHGWTYAASGQCVQFPAHPSQVPPPRAKANTFQCRVQYHVIWVCFSATPAPFPVYPEWDAPGVRFFAQGPFKVRAAGPRVIENFLDLAHLPVVHDGILGLAARPEIGKYNVTRTAEGVLATGIEIFQPDPDGSGRDGVAHYTYRVLRPLAAYLEKTAGSTKFTMMIVAAPVAETETNAWILFTLHDSPSTDAEALDWMERIFMQDVPIVESQKPELLPLDLQVELHLNSDRTSIAYRQWLSELGLTFGTS